MSIDFKNLTSAGFAPMAGLSDLSARRIMASYGAAFTVSEMISAKAICYGDEKTFGMIKGGGGDAPFGIQIFGHEPETMATAAKKLEEYAPDFIDINMGCPAPKIVTGGAGSALMRTPKLCGEIVSAVVSAISTPVTVKMRKGWDNDEITCTEVAKECEAAGAEMLCIHGRTREEMYVPPIDPSAIAAVKRSVKIPVIGNGDILTASEAIEMMSQTGCDAVMIGRGAMGNPWVFAEIRAMLKNEPAPQQPSLADKMKLFRGQIYGMCESKGEDRGMREARAQSMYYMKGLHGAAELRKSVCSLTQYSDLDELINLVYTLNKE